VQRQQQEQQGQQQQRAEHRTADGTKQQQHPDLDSLQDWDGVRQGEGGKRFDINRAAAGNRVH
jgi:hypothetical protein